MDHSPRKCAICEKYHCLAGCVPVESCQEEKRIRIARLSQDQKHCYITGKIGG